MPKTLKNNLILMFLAGLGILLALFNQIQVAQYFGASSERDTYFLANTFLTFLLTVHYRSVALFFLPRHITYIKTGGREGIGQGFVWIHFLGAVFLFLVLVALAYIFFTFNFLPFRDEALLFKILVILFLAFVFQTANNLITAIYHSQQSFVFPALLNILLLCIVIVGIYVFYQNGVIIIAWAYLAAYIFVFCFLFLFRFRFLSQNLQLSYNLDASKKILGEVLPFIGIGLITLSVHIIEPFFVAQEASGVISYLGYSYQIVLIMLSLISASILTTFFPKVADLHAQKKFEQVHQILLNTLKITFLVCLSISGFVFLFGYEIISLIFERGKFNPNDSWAIYNVLRWELFVFVFGSLNLLLNRFSYLNKNTKGLFWAAILGLGCYIISAFLFYHYFYYQGLGMALGLWAFVYFMVLCYDIIRKTSIRFYDLMFYFAKMLCLFSAIIYILWYLKFLIFGDKFFS